MATLQTQYRNYMEKNPLSEFTYEQWLKWYGEMLQGAYVEMKVPKNLYEKIPLTQDDEKNI
jgi:hypothetical protein